MNIFITGAQSFVGRALRAECRSKDISVTGLDLSPCDEPGIYQGDINDKELAALIPEQVDAIVHLAALSSDGACRGRSIPCFETNCMGTLNVIEAAQRRNARQFIFASSEWVYTDFVEGEPKDENSVIDVHKLTSEYALSKIVSEVSLRHHHLSGFCNTTVLRFGIIFGSRMGNWSAVETIYDSVLRKTSIEVGSVRTGRHFVHVSDVARAILKAIGLPGFEIINVQGDRCISLGEIIQASMDLTGKTPAVTELSPGQPDVRQIKNDKAKKVLEWTPRVGLRTGLVQLRQFLDRSWGQG